MLSKEEIEKDKIHLRNISGDVLKCKDDELIGIDAYAVGSITRILKYTEQLESNNQKLIEKLEERRKQNNNRYGQAIDDDEFLEMYEYSGQVQEDDYILEILKGEKEWKKK